MGRHKVIILLFSLLLLMRMSTLAYGQSNTTKEGSLTVYNTVQVINALSQEPEGDVVISLVRDSLSHHNQILTRNNDGIAELAINIKRKESFEIIILNKPGFISHSYNFQPYNLKGDTLKLYLQPRPYIIPTLTVTAKKQKYSNVNNSAYDLAMQVASEEKKRRRQNRKDYSYRQIDNITISAANISAVQNFLETVVPFYPSYLVPSKLDDSMVLPLSQRETVKKVAYNAKKNAINKDIQYNGIIGLDQNIDDGTFTVALHELFPSIDLFHRNVHLLDTEIPSPLSDVGHLQYRYYLTDTIIHKQKVAQVLEIVPRFPRVPSFTGRLLISMDSIPKLLKSELSFPHLSNINFVEKMKLTQNFSEVSPSEWCIKDEELIAEIRLFHKILTLNLNHTRKYDQYDFISPDSALLNARHSRTDSSKNRDLKAYADQLKQKELLASDEGLKHFMNKLRETPSHRFIMELVDAFSVNYIRTRWDENKIFGGSLLEIGPLNRMIEYNRHTGLRLQLGGRTTALLNNRNFLNGYIAYSTGTDKVTYLISGRHSFIPKRYYSEEFPRHDLTVSYGYDLHKPGNRINNSDDKNILFNVGVPHLTHYSYRRLFGTRYHYDLNSVWSIMLYYEHATDYPAGKLEFVRVLPDKSIIRYEYLQDALLGAEIRWSPGEQIFEGSMQRENWYQRQRQQQPVFTFRYEHAHPKLGGQYKRIRSEVCIEQKLWLGAFGRLDYLVNAGKIWSSVPFPYLYTPPLNRDFLISRFSFKGLQRSELVADEWLSLFAEYHMRGALANRIPFVKKLKLRGVFTFNMLWGNTTKRNLQGYGEELFLLPTIATEMNYKQPYIEVGWGFENIFKFMRIDVYRRITPMGPYSEGPWVVKMDLKLNF